MELQFWPEPHAAHTLPLAPHAIAVSLASGVHTPAEQQPEHGWLPQSHAPLVQAWPVAHAPHATPPVPHAEPDCPAPPAIKHAPAESQQPFGHDVASQTHWPVDVSHS